MLLFSSFASYSYSYSYLNLHLHLHENLYLNLDVNLNENLNGYLILYELLCGSCFVLNLNSAEGSLKSNSSLMPCSLSLLGSP